MLHACTTLDQLCDVKLGIDYRARLFFDDHVYQNTDQEKALCDACETGDLETVKRLSGQVTVRYVRDHSYFCDGESALHKAARLDLLLTVIV